MDQRTIRLVAGDSFPAIAIHIRNELSGNIRRPESMQRVDVSKAIHIYMRFRPLEGATLETMTLEPVTDGTDGELLLPEWPPSVLDVEPGRYEGVITIEWPRNKQQTLKSRIPFNIAAPGK